MDSFELELKISFLGEATPLIEDSESALMELDKGNHSPEQINKIFRMAHNLKGTARSVGFGDLADFSHKVEDVLSKIKNNQMPITKDVCSVLLRSIDTLKNAIEEYKKNLDYKIETDENERELLRLLTSPQEGSEATPVTEAVPEVAPSEGAEGGQEQYQQLLDQMVEDYEKKNTQENLPLPPTPRKESPEPIVFRGSDTIAPPKKKEASTSLKIEEFLRVSTLKLDKLMEILGEVVINQSILSDHRKNETTARADALTTIQYMEKLVAEMQDICMSLRLTPVKQLFQRMERAVRDIAVAQNKTVNFSSIGDHIELDKTIIEKITDPLNHLIRNAIDHGIEPLETRLEQGKEATATIELWAEQRDDTVTLIIADDGKGLNHENLTKKAKEKKLIPENANLSPDEAYQLIFLPGFSTREQVTDISGRGVGMDVVKRAVDELKGQIEIETELGKGTVFRITLPLSLSIITGIVVDICAQKFVVPISQMVETIDLINIPIELVGGIQMMNLRNELIPIFSLSGLLGMKSMDKTAKSKDKIGIITTIHGAKLAFEVDQIYNQQQIVIKKLGNEIDGIRGIIGGAILNSGEPGLIINLHEFVSHSMKKTRNKHEAA